MYILQAINEQYHLCDVQYCLVCKMYNRANQKEPLFAHTCTVTRSRLWDKVGVDHFSFAAKDYS